MASPKEIRNHGSFIEEAYGFAQAVKVDDTVYISGQTAFLPEGRIVGVGDMEAQMRQAYASIASLLEGYGANMGNIVDETLYVTDIAAAATVARKVRGALDAGDIRPVTKPAKSKPN